MKCPCGPKLEHYGYEATCWREFPPVPPCYDTCGTGAPGPMFVVEDELPLNLPPINEPVPANPFRNDALRLPPIEPLPIDEQGGPATAPKPPVLPPQGPTSFIDPQIKRASAEQSNTAWEALGGFFRRLPSGSYMVPSTTALSRDE